MKSEESRENVELDGALKYLSRITVNEIGKSALEDQVPTPLSVAPS